MSLIIRDLLWSINTVKNDSEGRKTNIHANNKNKSLFQAWQDTFVKSQMAVLELKIL